MREWLKIIREMDVHVLFLTIRAFYINSIFSYAIVLLKL